MTDRSPAAQRLMISYDGSDDAKHAIEHAGHLFPGRDATVITAWQPIVVAISAYGFAGTPLLPNNVAELDHEVEEAARRTAGEGVEQAKAAGLEAEAATVESDGPVWKALVDAADERQAAAIVMGPRGLSGIKSALLGSVSHGVVQHARRPVLIVPRGPNQV